MARLTSTAAKVLTFATLTAATVFAIPGAANAGCPSCVAAQNVGRAQLALGAATIAGGLAVGALAALRGGGYGGDCYVEHRRVYDDYGNVFFRRVRVCE